MFGFRRLRKLTAIASFAALAAGAAASAAQARDEDQPRLHVLLIAATDYEERAVSDMPSAAADAFLLARVLLDRGARAADVRIVTEGAPPDSLWPAHELSESRATREDAAGLARRGVTPLGAATRARVLAELDRLVEVAGPGEQAFISMSGHGEQQPTEDRVQEPDGFDETFIPTDVVRTADGRWTNVVVDDEIGERVQALIAKGVQVVFVGDFCHSEGATRGSAARRAAGGRSDVRLMGGVGTTDAEGQGRFTGFYAAPSLSQALALLVPYWAEDRSAQRKYGALTYYLATALQDPSLGTMRDVAVRVERDINMHSRMGSTLRQNLPPPQFEGDFTAPLPGSGTGLAASLWQVSKPVSTLTVDGRVELSELSLPAGALNGVEAGAVYALSQTREGRDQVVLYGRAEDVTATRATLRPVAAGDLTEAAWTDVKEGDGSAMQRNATFTARLFAPGAPETVWVARPERPANPTPAQAEALADLDALFDIQTRGLESSGGSSVQLPSYVRLAEPGAAVASLRLAFDTTEGADRLVIADDIENGRPLASMDLDRALTRIRPEGAATRLTGLRSSIAEGLMLASRFQRIRSAAIRVSDAADDQTVSAFEGLGLTVYRHRQGGDAACRAPWPSGGQAAWAGVEGTPAGAVEIDPADLGSPGGAQACDIFVIEVRNEGSAAIARDILGARTPADWPAACDRVGGATVAPEQTFACAQPVSVGAVVFSSDTAITALRVNGGTDAEKDSGAIRLNRGGRARYVYGVTNSNPDFLMRTDFMILATRSEYRQDALPVRFSQLCQRRLQLAFDGPMGPGERTAEDPCLTTQSAFRSARAAEQASAPATVDGLFDLLSDGPNRSGGAQPVGGTTMRRLTLQVTPRSANE